MIEVLGLPFPVLTVRDVIKPPGKTGNFPSTYELYVGDKEDKWPTCHKGETKKNKILMSSQRGSLLKLLQRIGSVSVQHSPLAKQSVGLWEFGDDPDIDHELKEVLFAFLFPEKTSACLSLQIIPSAIKNWTFWTDSAFKPCLKVWGVRRVWRGALWIFYYLFLLHHYTAFLPSNMSGFLENLPDLKPSSIRMVFRQE